MENIQRIHNKVLDYLLAIQKENKDFLFVPRKINNNNRLNEGYWFIGNETYLQVSFWDGMDWKEKIHNIGFVILSNGESYIELSAQDSAKKASFLEKIVPLIPKLKKNDSKNKWYKYYSGNDYIKNLNNFIEKVKPKIDSLIEHKQPLGIKIPNGNKFQKYISTILSIKERQEANGVLNKLSKICWNTENWKFPSGSKGKSISIESYESDARYGHEEWLFNKFRIIDDYHYAFLQPLNLKSSKHDNKIYNISLFTINNLKKQYYVGEIKNVECITPEESEKIYKIYKSNGWLREMFADIKRVGGNTEKFNQTPASIFFNIKFLLKNIIKPDELIEISKRDINITTDRYKLLPKKADILFEIETKEEFEGNIKNTNRRRRVFNSDSEFDPYHDQMQNAIFNLLKKSKKYKNVFIERNRIDIKAKTLSGSWHYFELKTDSPKLSVRKALGQIIEYAFFPDEEKAEKLIIIADEQPDEDVITYLKHIRTKFNLPITYRHFDLNSNKLSDDY